MSSAIQTLEMELKANPAVKVIAPKDAEYEQSRRIYNRMHDRLPGLIVQTRNVDALRMILSFSSATGIPFVVRGGGHHIAGFSTCNDGIVIDFSPFRKVEIHEDQNIASVEPGARLADLDSTLTAAGFVVPSGTVSDTGVAGLTLSGGIGWLVGSHGLTCDFLCGADVLLSDGRVVRAEDPQHADLLWALRGGGGNFGIVLEFRYRLSPLPKTICGSGTVQWNQISPVFDLLFEYLETRCPREMSIAPVLSVNGEGERILRIDFCYSGSNPNEIEPLLGLAESIQWQDVKQWEFKAWQSAFDAHFLPPLRGYWKASYMRNITKEMRQELLKSLEQVPSRNCSILIEHLHGAFKEQAESSFPLREANFGILFSARWPDASEDQRYIEWARQSFDRIDPNESSGTYSNYTSFEDRRAVRDLMANARLAAVKLHYDPQNRFCSNHNISSTRTST